VEKLATHDVLKTTHLTKTAPIFARANSSLPKFSSLIGVTATANCLTATFILSYAIKVQVRESLTLDHDRL
jgi:hypothetical protein